ncbi:MAG: PaaI family thioesterase [Abditibacteriota bacterium]|nr:PaaI family thioesterase [Abditibacteriota bacterium]
MNTVAEANEYFEKDRFATEAASCVIEAVGDDYAKCSITIQPKHLNAAGRVMGGAIFTLADFTFAVASNTPEKLTVSLTSEICYLGPVRGTKLFAESEKVKYGKTTCTFLIHVTDDLGNQVALVTATGMRVK